MKHSRQRDALLTLLQSTNSHPSADKLYEKLREEFPNISLGTVYRNLNVLTENGDIIKLQISSSKEYFDGHLEKHYHFVCRSCGCISDVSLEGADALEKEAEKTLQAEIDETSLVFYGLCKDCAQKNNKYKEEKIMAKYVCPVCGYVHEGDEPPEKCPVCNVPGSKFTVMEEGKLNFACEHVIGVGAKGKIEDDVYEGLKSNFEGECSEVGMYIAMSRQAIREGYPEIGEFYMRAAYEEAEHAAKFAELLGEVVTTSTKENLRMRAEAECGATAGKLELAKRAKELNYDAIHDTVHEMAKDEARHGKGFEGLLKRYFG